MEKKALQHWSLAAPPRIQLALVSHERLTTSFNFYQQVILCTEFNQNLIINFTFCLAQAEVPIRIMKPCFKRSPKSFLHNGDLKNLKRFIPVLIVPLDSSLCWYFYLILGSATTLPSIPLSFSLFIDEWISLIFIKRISKLSLSLTLCLTLSAYWQCNKFSPCNFKFLKRTTHQKFNEMRIKAKLSTFVCQSKQLLLQFKVMERFH